MDNNELEPFMGEWKLIDSENFIEYLKATGAPSVICKLFKNSKPELEIRLSKDKEWVVFLTKFLLKDFSIKVKANGSEHMPDLPLGAGKKAKESLTCLKYDKESGAMSVDIWSTTENTRNCSTRRVITHDENGTLLERPQMVLDLHFEGKSQDDSKEASDEHVSCSAKRVFEKIVKTK